MIAANEEDPRREIAKAVVLAALTAAATKLAEWAVEELRDLVRKDGGQ